MNKVIQRKLIVVLSIIALWLCISINSAYAVDSVSGTYGDNLFWELIPNEDGETQTLIISGEGDMIKSGTTPWLSYRNNITKIIVDDGVTSICEHAFSYSPAVTSVELPEGLVKIDSFAFSCCYELASITIPKSVTEIGAYAFQHNNMTNCIIPDSVTKVGTGIFRYCENLESVEISNALTDIEGMFFGCTKLESFTIPENVTEIGHETFGECTSLKCLAMTGTTNIIRQDAFKNCTKLTDLYIYNGTGFVIYLGNEYFSKAEEHRFKNDKIGDWTLVQDATCVENGKKLKFTPGHSVYEEEVIPATGIHDWTDWRTTINPGCETNGKEERQCKMCFAKEENDIPATGHSWKDTRIIKKPTNVETGIKEQKCDSCNAIRETEIPPVTDFNITPKAITIDQPYSSFKGGCIECYGWGDSNVSFAIKPTTDRIIENVTTSDKKIVSISKEENGAYYLFEPVGLGTAIITCTDEYGNTDTCEILVTSKYMSSYISEYTHINTIRSGEAIKGYTHAGATVSTKIAGKQYSVKANGAGNFSFKIPVVKIGSKINVTVKYHNATKQFKKKIIKPTTRISTPNIYRTSSTIRVTAKKVHKGDTIVLKIGKRTYKRKIKKDASRIKYKQKIKKAKEGTKVKITVNNKYKQKIYTKSKKVYYASKVKKGMSKKQCKLVPGWEHPSDVMRYKNRTGWWYDDGSWLVFSGDRLISWHY